MHWGEVRVLRGAAEKADTRGAGMPEVRVPGPAGLLHSQACRSDYPAADMSLLFDENYDLRKMLIPPVERSIATA